MPEAVEGDLFWANVAAMIAVWTRGYRKVGECEVCDDWLVVGPSGFKTQMRRALSSRSAVVIQ